MRTNQTNQRKGLRLTTVVLCVMLLLALPLTARADAIADDFNEAWGWMNWWPEADYDSSWGVPADFPADTTLWGAYWRDYQQYLNRDVFTPMYTSATELKTATIGNVSSWVNLRGGPSMDADVIGKLDRGTLVQLNNWSIDGKWAHVLYNGGSQAAWVYYEYIVP